MNVGERYNQLGAEAITDAQALALLLRPGTTRSASLKTAHALLAQFGNLNELLHCDPAELQRTPGIGPAKAAQILIALQLGRRSIAGSIQVKSPILHPQQAATHLAPPLRGLKQEEFHALYLCNNLELIAHRRLTIGTQNRTLISPQIVFRPAITRRASCLILAHNHPQGPCHPSRNDQETTRLLGTAGDLLGISLLDHLIIGRNGSYSMTEKYQIPHAELDDLVTLPACGLPSTKSKARAEHSDSTATGC